MKKLAIAIALVAWGTATLSAQKAPATTATHHPSCVRAEKAQIQKADADYAVAMEACKDQPQQQAVKPCCRQQQAAQQGAQAVQQPQQGCQAVAAPRDCQQQVAQPAPECNHAAGQCTKPVSEQCDDCKAANQQVAPADNNITAQPARVLPYNGVSKQSAIQEAKAAREKEIQTLKQQGK